MTERIIIFDTTLRDGEQSPGIALDVKEKLEIANQLARLGVDVIEAGFPAASPGDFEGVRAIAETVRGASIAALCRTRPEDVERAWDAIKPAERPRIHTFISTSPIHRDKKLRMTTEQVLEETARAVAQARGLCDDVEFSAEDATRTELPFLIEVFAAAIENGATTINVPDTVGFILPEEFVTILDELRARVPGADDVVWSVHCHNDLGLATANSLAAVRAGARQVEVCVNGIGERAGNAALEEVVMALRTHSPTLGFQTGIDTREITRTSRLVSMLSGYSVQPNKSVVGANAFSHESGIHQHGVLMERTTYEILLPVRPTSSASTPAGTRSSMPLASWATRLRGRRWSARSRGSRSWPTASRSSPTTTSTRWRPRRSVSAHRGRCGTSTGSPSPAARTPRRGRPCGCRRVTRRSRSRPPATA